MEHWSRAADCFYVRGKGVLITTDSNPYNFKVEPDWPITLFSPEGVAFTTVVRGVERYARAFQLPGESCGILLAGFEKDANLSGWTFVVHEPGLVG